MKLSAILAPAIIVRDLRYLSPPCKSFHCEIVENISRHLISNFLFVFRNVVFLKLLHHAYPKSCVKSFKISNLKSNLEFGES